MNPIRSVQQFQGTVGPNAFALFVTKKLRWIYRPVHQEHDFGIDGYIDVVDKNKVTGSGLAVQIKCGQSYVSKQTKGGIRYEGEIKHLNYYFNLPQPVLLIVLDENGTNGWWVQSKLEQTMPCDSPDRWWIEIPNKNRVTSSVAPIWRALAGPTSDMTSAFKKEWARTQLNDLCTNLLVAIRKDGVVACDPEPLFLWQSQLLKTREMMLKKHASIDFWFEGWEDDQRELWDIPEARTFYRRSLEEGFPWIYWLQPDFLWLGYQLLFACGCDVNTKTIGNDVHIEPASWDALKEWIEANFHALNVFSDAHTIPGTVNKKCSDNLTRFVRTQLQQSCEG